MAGGRGESINSLPLRANKVAKGSAQRPAISQSGRCRQARAMQAKSMAPLPRSVAPAQKASGKACVCACTASISQTRSTLKSKPALTSSTAQGISVASQKRREESAPAGADGGGIGGSGGGEEIGRAATGGKSRDFSIGGSGRQFCRPDCALPLISGGGCIPGGQPLTMCWPPGRMRPGLS